MSRVPTAKRRKRQPPAKRRSATATVTTLTDDAYRLIKWRITTVQLPPGTSFTEFDLTEDLGLGRTPIREALLLLRREGLVTVGGRSGYRISSVTLRDVHELAAVRRALEAEVASHAAARLIEAGQIESLKERLPGAIDQQDPTGAAGWIEADRRFHLALAVAAGNQHLVAAIEPVLEKASRLLYLVQTLDPRASGIEHDHDDLLAALRAHDANRARQIAAEAISSTELAVANALTSRPGLMSANFVVESPRNEFYLDVPAANPHAPTVTLGPARARSRSSLKTRESIEVRS